MANNNGSDDSFTLRIKEECSPNIKVQEVDEKIIKTETEVIEGSWVPQNVDINELLQNGNRKLENSAKQLLNKKRAMDTITKTVNMCREMADNNKSDLNYPANIKIEEEDEKVVKTETEVFGKPIIKSETDVFDGSVIKTETEIFGGSWVDQNMYTNELPENENRTLDNFAKQLLNENLVCQSCDVEYKDYCMNHGHLCANRQKNNENEIMDEEVNLDGEDGDEEVSEQKLIENVQINNKEETAKLNFPKGDNDCLCSGAMKKQILDSKLARMSIDSELLITLVEARPVLWDKNLDNHKNRHLTRNAWNEVCIELNSEFEKLGDKEKDAFGKEILKRWTNLRDSYLKSLKKIKGSKSSGSAAKKLKQYVYNNELQFLKKLYAERETSNSLSEDNGCDEIKDNAVEVLGKPIPTKPDQKAQKSTRKHKRVDKIELKILKALQPKQPEKPDPHMSFLHSLLPHLQNFNTEEFLQFQMGVLHVISNLSKRKKGISSTILSTNQLL